MHSLDGTGMHKLHALIPHGHIVTNFLLLHPTHLPSQLSVYDHSAVIYDMTVWSP